MSSTMLSCDKESGTRAHSVAASSGKGVYDAPKLDAEEAETSVFDSVMRRAGNNGTATADHQQLHDLHEHGTNDDPSPPKSPKQIFRNAVMKVQTLQKLKSIRNLTAGSRHRQQASRAQDLLESIQQTESPSSNHNDLLLSHVDGRNDNNDEEETDADESEIEGDGEELPLRGGHLPRYGSVAEAISYARSHKKRKRCANRLKQRILDACHTENLVRFLQQAVLHSCFVFIGIPCAGLSWILFYYLGNPVLDFLPGTATLAWWLNFLCRQMVTLDVARLSQWILFDCIILAKRKVSRLLGPTISLYCMQAKGWPVVATGWALIDMAFLHGNDKFCIHWLYWSGLQIYSLDDAISGSYIISSPLYLRVLIAMLLAGLASSVKRFLVSFWFSQRRCRDFKPRLEKIMMEMILVSEIASLAEQAVLFQNSALMGSEGKIDLKTEVKARGIQSVAFDIDPSFDDEQNEDEHSKGSPTSRHLRNMSNGQSSVNSSGRLPVKSLLDPWEPPVNKNVKTEVLIRDVLLFNAAVAYMNDENPFGEAFGPASDRNECIHSSEHLYASLLSLNTVEGSLLDFEVLVLATCNEEGKVDSGKKNMLRRLFRPDSNGQVTELAFIQSCDAIYKRLCFFRASVGNASVIDKMLVSIVDVFFYFILLLMLLSLLEFNPWTLLVSMTSLLVSVSFALGPSLSKYVEGVLLIAVHRPFDLGDRIYIGPANTIDVGGEYPDTSSNTWFVEDINLTTTTLRYARTNEVSTLNNWAIAGSKIINCNRSPGATIALKIMLHISILQGNALDCFQSALEEYVETHPRIWDSLVSCRHDAIDADNEQVAFTLSFRHRNSWQDAGRIKLNRAELVRFVHELAEKLKVSYESPPPRRLVYQGGVLEHGQVEDFKKNLLKPTNIRSNGQGSLAEIRSFMSDEAQHFGVPQQRHIEKQDSGSLVGGPVLPGE